MLLLGNYNVVTRNRLYRYTDLLLCLYLELVMLIIHFFFIIIRLMEKYNKLVGNTCENIKK